MRRSPGKAARTPPPPPPPRFVNSNALLGLLAIASYTSRFAMAHAAASSADGNPQTWRHEVAERK